MRRRGETEAASAAGAPQRRRPPQKKDVARPRLRKVVLQTQTAPCAEYKRVCEIARKLPGVEESSSYGTPALKVKGRFLCRLRSEAEGALGNPVRFPGPADPAAGGSGSVLCNGSLPRTTRWCSCVWTEIRLSALPISSSAPGAWSHR